MTKAENKAIKAWNIECGKYHDMAIVWFGEMQELCRRHGFAATCSIGQNLRYMLTSGDEAAREKALALYTAYVGAEAKFESMLALIHEMP